MEYKEFGIHKKDMMLEAHYQQNKYLANYVGFIFDF